MQNLLEQGLIIIESDVFDICNRLKEYDQDLVLCYDERKEVYQVWTKGGNCAAVSDKLDARLIEAVKCADGRTSYGFKAKLDAVRKQKAHEEARERIEARDNAKAVRSELNILDKGRKSFVL